MYESNNGYEPNVSYEDVPVRTPGTGFAIVSLVFGLTAFFGLIMGGAPITGTIAVITGIIHIKRSSEKRVFAVLGMVLGLLGIIISFVLLSVVMVNLLPTTEEEIFDIYRILDQYSV